MSRKLRLEEMEQRVCPTGTTAAAELALVSTPLPPHISADLTRLTHDLNTAAADFVSIPPDPVFPPDPIIPPTPIRTEIADVVRVVGDTSRLAFDVRAETHADLGGMIGPLVSLEFDEAALYFDFASGDTAGALTAGQNEQTDLARLGTSLQGTDTTGLAANVFGQAETAFHDANDTLFGINLGSDGGGGGVT